MSEVLDSEILDIFGDENAESGPFDDGILDEEEVLDPEIPPASISQQIDPTESHNVVLEEPEESAMGSSQTTSHSSAGDKLFINESGAEETEENLVSEAKICSDHSNEVDKTLNDSLDDQPAEELLDYGEEIPTESSSKDEDVSHADDPSINNDSDDEDTQRRDRFATERKIHTVKPSEGNQNLNVPATLDEVIIRPDNNVVVNNGPQQNYHRRSRWVKGSPQQSSPQKLFSVRLMPPTQIRAAANFVQSQPNSVPMRNPNDLGFADPQRVHINPHFRGSVPVNPNVRLAWDHPMRPVLPYPPSVPLYANGPRLQQPFVANRPPIPVFPLGNQFPRFMSPGGSTAPAKQSAWPPVIHQPPPLAVFGSRSALASAQSQGESQFQGWDAETLAFINKLGAPPKPKPVEPPTAPAHHHSRSGPSTSFANVSRSREVAKSHDKRLKDRVGKRKVEEDDDEVVVVKVKSSPLDVDDEYMREMAERNSLRSIVLQTKHRRRYEAASQLSSPQSVATTSDTQVKLNKGDWPVEKTLKKVIPTALLNDLPVITRSVIVDANSFRSYRDPPAKPTVGGATQSPAANTRVASKIIRLRDPVANGSSVGGGSQMVKTRITPPESPSSVKSGRLHSTVSLMEPRKNISSLSAAAANSGRVALIQPIRQRTAIGYPGSSHGPKPVNLTGVEPNKRSDGKPSLSDRWRVQQHK